MHAVQYKHPSDTEYRVVRITDPVDAVGKHYAVAVDIYDKRNSDILKSLLNVLSRNDHLTLITFGEHTEKFMFTMDSDYHKRLETFLSRKETGLNTLVAVRTLEQVEADEYIMITAGYHDSVPVQDFKHKKKVDLFQLKSKVQELQESMCDWQENMMHDAVFGSEELLNKSSEEVTKLQKEITSVHDKFMHARGKMGNTILYVFSPGGELASNYVKSQHKIYFPRNGPHEQIIRKVFNIKCPNYFNIKLEGSFGRLYAKTPAWGGCHTIQLPTPQLEPVKITYMLYDGTMKEQECDKDDDADLPDMVTRMKHMQETFMKPCAMFE
jgi:predicted HicB family RNase H-like nuclease